MSQRPGEHLRDQRPIAAPAAPPVVPAPAMASAAPSSALPTTPPAQPAQVALDPNRFGLLKKPLAERPDHYGALRSPPPTQPPTRWPTR